jgi:hypothetical protein
MARQTKIRKLATLSRHFSNPLRVDLIYPGFAEFKGWLGEMGAQVGMWFWLDGKVYRRIHTLVIRGQGAFLAGAI